MKKRNLLLTVLCLAAVTSCAAGIAACSSDSGHAHDWSDWTVTEENKPTETAEGKATRTCNGEGDCDATEADKEYILPALTSEDYTSTPDNATCSSAGVITYVYNKDGVNVSFAVATPINPDAHSYGDYTYADGTGHYKVCEYDSGHTTELEPHDANGKDGSCSVCGYKEAEHSHDWSDWTVTEENKPTETAEGKATRTCNGEGDCDATEADKEIILPKLTSSEYAKSDDTATCSSAGAITYTYNKDGATVKFDVPTPVNPDAHSYGDYTYSDGEGHYKVCAYNTNHRTEVEPHDANGKDGSCSVCGYKEATKNQYTVTVTGAGAGITVKLGEYTATTDEYGVAKFEAVKQDYTVVVENTVTVGNLSKSYSYEAATVTAENPEATVALPTYLQADLVEGAYFNATETITEDGLYFFDIYKTTDTFITIKNTTDITKKYTITILDSGSVYALNGDLNNIISDPFDLYIIKNDTNEQIFTQESIITRSAASGVTVIKVTSVDYEDGTVYTPIPISLGEEITLTSETVYYTPAVNTNVLVNFTVSENGTVVWLGNNINNDGTAVLGRYFLDTNENYYFTATGTGTVTINREYIDGEDMAHSIALTKDSAQNVSIGVLGGYIDNVRWFKFTGVNTAMGYLTLESTSEVSYTVYENGVKISDEDVSVLAVSVTEGNEYNVRVYYKGDFDGILKTANFNLVLRDYRDTDAIGSDNGEDKDDPYALITNVQDENYENRASCEVTFNWANATNNTRYLQFTATEAGELEIIASAGINCTLYTDSAFTVDADYTKTGTVDGDICTIYLNADTTVYILLTGVTLKGMTATATFTKAMPVDYTVVVKDSLGGKVGGVCVELWNANGQVGETLSTNADGVAVFNVTPAEYTVKIITDDYAYDKEVTTESNLVGCTTEITVIEYVQYTIVLSGEDGINLSGLTVSLKDTEAIGTTDGNGSVTFTQKVKLGVYEVVVEGYVVMNKTSASSATATVNIVSSSAFNIITGTIVATALKGDGEGGDPNAELLEGLNRLNTHGTTIYSFGWFKASESGEYTFTVTTDDMYFYTVCLNSMSTRYVYQAAVNLVGDAYVRHTLKDISGTESVVSITLRLEAGDIVAISCSKNKAADITITKNLNEITGTTTSIALTAANETAALKIGENLLTTTKYNYYCYFKAEEEGIYTFSVQTAEYPIKFLALNDNSTWIVDYTDGLIVETTDASYVSHTIKQLNGEDMVGSITLNLSAGDVIALSCGSNTLVANITVTKN